MADKKLTEEIRAELQPELDALAERYFEMGKRAGPGATLKGAGAGAAASSGRTGASASIPDAAFLARKAREKQAAANAIGLPLTNEEAVKAVYAEAGIPLD